MKIYFNYQVRTETMTIASLKPRVVIDFNVHGDFIVYSDAQAEVIVRCAHAPEDELVRYGHYPIPEEWLQGKRVGFLGDGSEYDKRAQLLAKALEAARRA
jgi:hypothetical protein